MRSPVVTILFVAAPACVVGWLIFDRDRKPPPRPAPGPVVLRPSAAPLPPACGHEHHDDATPWTDAKGVDALVDLLRDLGAKEDGHGVGHVQHALLTEVAASETALRRLLERFERAEGEVAETLASVLAFTDHPLVEEAARRLMAAPDPARGIDLAARLDRHSDETSRALSALVAAGHVTAVSALRADPSLGEATRREAAAAVRQACASADETMRRRATEALADWEERTVATDTLVGLAREDASPAVRRAAAMSLARYRPAEPRVADALLAILQDASVPVAVREGACATLEVAAAQDPAARDACARFRAAQ